MNPVSHRLTIHKDLDDFREWSAKFRHWMVDIAETDAHDVWICVDHVRSFHPEMPKNKDLTVTYRRSMFYVKDGGRHFISESGLRSLIQTTAKSHQHVDALRFLDWFDRNITQVAVKKRTERDRVESIAQQDAQDKLASDGMQPIELAHSSLRERLVSQCNDLQNTATSFWHGERKYRIDVRYGPFGGIHAHVPLGVGPERRPRLGW